MDFTSAQSILIIDDDSSLRSLLTQLLTAEGFRTTAVGDVQGGLQAVAAEQPALVLLDRGLPDADGLSVVEELRRRGGGCPVVLLTARDAVQDRVDGLEAGADDYIVKPFDSDELTARIRAHVRRSEREGEGAPQLGDLVLDPLHRTVTRAGRLAKLTQREYSLLAVLIQHAGETISREQLAREAWGQVPAGAATNSVDVYIAYLRSKIEHDDLPPLLQTVRRAGYVLQAHTTPAE